MKKFSAALKIAIWISVVLILSGFMSGCSDDVSGPGTDGDNLDGISFTVTGGHEAEYTRAGSLLGYQFGDEYFYQLLIDRPANVDWELMISGSPGSDISDVVAGDYEIVDSTNGITAVFVDKSVDPQRSWYTQYQGMGGTLKINSVSNGIATGSFLFAAGQIGDEIADVDRFIEVEGTFQVPVNPD